MVYTNNAPPSLYCWVSNDGQTMEGGTFEKHVFETIAYLPHAEFQVMHFVLRDV